MLGGEAHLLGREFGVCLRHAFVIVVPRCPGLVELVGELLVSGSFRKQFFLEEVIGGSLARVGMVGVPYFGGQDLIPCRGLLLVGGGLLGPHIDLE